MHDDWGEAMNEFRELLPFLKQWSTYLDIGIIAFIIYKLMMLIKETRAEQLIKGIIILIVITKLSDFMQLHTMYWLLRNAMTVGAIAILIIFQPELRRALEHIGRGKLFFKNELQEQDIENMLKEISAAVSELSKNKIGAIIVIEQETGLNEFIATGVKLDSSISAGLFINIFTPNTPLHDGAVIIRKNRIAAAGCFLPLTDNQNLNKQLGTRHRAALGITEISDSLVIIVSEETGVISFARDGKLSRYLDPKSLKEILKNEYVVKEQIVLPKWGGKNE